MTNWLDETLTELLLPRVSPPCRAVKLPRPASSSLLAGALILTASIAQAGSPLPAYMELPVARPTIDCSVAPPWRSECSGARRQSDRTNVSRSSAAPDGSPGLDTDGGGGAPQDRPNSCNSCPDRLTGDRKRHRDRWHENHPNGDPAKAAGYRDQWKTNNPDRTRDEQRDHNDSKRDDCPPDGDAGGRR